MLWDGSTALRRAFPSGSSPFDPSRTSGPPWAKSKGGRSAGLSRLRSSAGAPSSGEARRSAFGAEAAAPSLISSSNGSIGSDIADVILPTDRREAAALAPIDVVRRRREFPARDGIDGIGQPLLRPGEHLGAIRRRREQRDHTPRPLERQVHGFPKRPAAAVVPRQALLR